MPRPKTEGLTDALTTVLVSPNEHDSNGEAANVVDALFAAGRIVRHGLMEVAAADHSNCVADGSAKQLPLGKFTLGSGGLVVNGEPSFEEWQQIGAFLAHAEGAVQWWIGDWLNYGEHSYGEKYSQALTPAQANTWRQFAWVARTFEMSRRRDISWSHHKEVASLPAAAADVLLSKAAEEELSQREVRRLARSTQRAIAQGESSGRCCTVDDLRKLVAAGRSFGCIYADPPWPYGNQGTRAATDNHYGTMPVEDIAALPVAALAAAKCHLHLWTTNAFLREALGLLDGWGFAFKSTFVWAKPQLGIGNYWRCSHEIMLLGVRGGLTFPPSNIPSWLEHDRTEHSRKPEAVRRLIEQLSPGPYLELFGRRVADGWTVWGNEIAADLLVRPNPR
jgi:N6-adenosine-specific RNA methylase IME4